MTQKEVNKIIKRHQHYLERDCKGWRGMRADFSNEDLSGLNFEKAKLDYANFENANLEKANLQSANLHYVNFMNANLDNANLFCTNLDFSNFAKASLYKADISLSNLTYTNFAHANVSQADIMNSNFNFAILNCAIFRDANLVNSVFTSAICFNACFENANLKGSRFYDAELSTANLINANLEKASLYGCNLRNTYLNEEEKCRFGEILKEPLIGYKKTREGKIVTLEIPKGAIVYSIDKDKYRTNKAKVIDTDGKKVLTSIYNSIFKYHVGDEIEIDDFDLMYNIDCSTGIHFFKTKEEAKKYVL